MNHDGELESRCQDDVNKDVHDSLNNDEFSIQCSNLHSGGLKFKISLKKRNNEEELCATTGTNLKQLATDKDVRSVCLHDGNMDVQHKCDNSELPSPLISNQPSGKNNTEVTVLGSHSCSVEIKRGPLGQDGTQWITNDQASNDDSNSKTKLAASKDVDRLKENVKTHKTTKQPLIGNHATFPDGHEGVLRLDALPNVSPDSGILSCNGSPSGNESPRSVGALDMNLEASHGNLDSSALPADGQPSADGRPSGKADSQESEQKGGTCDSREENVGPSGGEGGASIHKHSESENTAATSSGGEGCVHQSQIHLKESLEASRHEQKEWNSEREVVRNNNNNEVLTEKCSVAATVDSKSASPKPSAIYCDLLHGDNVSPVTESFMNAVVVSSPTKICQNMRRKKRGRNQKKKKLSLLSHKKSTLYNMGSPDSTTEPRKEEDEEEESKGACENLGNYGSSMEIDSSLMNSEVSSSDKAGYVQDTSKYPSTTQIDLPVKVKQKNSAVTKKRSPGRPKGSLNKKVSLSFVTKRNVKRAPAKLQEIEEEKLVKSVPPVVSVEIVKRQRGRPRKNPLPVNELNEESKKTTLVGVKKATVKIHRKRRIRKRVFTHMKRSTTKKEIAPQDAMRKGERNLKCSEKQGAEGPKTKESRAMSPRSTPIASTSSRSPPYLMKPTQKREKAHSQIPGSSDGPLKSVFQDKDFDALLKKVKSSISSQFTTDEEHGELIESLSFDNPFKSVQTPSFPCMAQARAIQQSTKPKYKKPKPHVMMRKNTRKKRKKFQSSRLGSFGASSPQKRLSFFTSCVQPPKILASCRLNVFQSGTGNETDHRSATPTDAEQLDSSDKRGKKRRKLLYFKSKHKNIVDPVFAQRLDVLVSGLENLAISEGSGETFIRVRPGEMPLPSIFRVTKIDVDKEPRERLLHFEPTSHDGLKSAKTKREHHVAETSAPFSKLQNKSIRKRSSSDHAFESSDHLSMSDTSDQCLPPKKRHRMVNIDSILSQPLETCGSGEFSPFARKDTGIPADRRKGRRYKRPLGQGPFRQGERASLLRTSQQPMDVQLTIDTCSYSTGGSSMCTPSVSPSPGRLSTRSSTLPSLSSPSPSESSGVRSRHHSRSHVQMTCPAHSHCVGSPEDMASCAECQLLLQSTLAPSVSGHKFGRSILMQNVSRPVLVEPACNPGLKSLNDGLSRRTHGTRRKMFNASVEESDSSPPRLEKQCTLSPRSFDSSVCPEPPEITNSLCKGYPLQNKRTARKGSHPLSSSTLAPSSVKSRSCVNSVQLRHPRHSSTTSPNASCPKVLCNTAGSSPCASSSSKSVISECSGFEPLPLEHCTKRKLVEEIKAALQSHCSDSDSSSDEEEEKECSNPSKAAGGQLPRKRFQRAGLFSDFYKDNEVKRRNEATSRCKDKQVYVKAEHQHGLMPLPIHIGQHYMEAIRDFRLPYDIWLQEQNNQLPKKSEPKVKFRTIRSNVYSDSKVNMRRLETPPCSCQNPPSGGRGCLDDCLNRMIYTECSPTNCPLGDNCGNQRIQKHEWAPGIEKFLTKDRGHGVIAAMPVKNGQFILEYLGEVVSEVEFRRRMMEEYSEECHHYALHFESGNVIDSYRMGNVGRYVNHSCQPNCEMQKWNVNGLYRMVLSALQDIHAGDELSYDYNFDSFNQQTQQECLCGSKDCRGVIGGKTQRTANQNGKAEKLVEDPKDKRKSKLMSKKMREKKHPESVLVLPPVKPMTYKERCYARKHRTFLVRNVDKVRNQRHPGQVLPITKEELDGGGKVNCVTSDLLLANLTESSVKTRLAAFAKDNPEVFRRHQLAQIFDKMLTELLSLKDEDGSCLVTPLMSLPSRKKQPQFYQVVRDPIDMSMIKQRVKTGYYNHLSSFNADVLLLFTNVELYCGPKSDLGQVILKLRRIFNCVKQELASQLDEILGQGTTKAHMDTDLEKLEEASAKVFKEPEEDIIRCICGVTRDEGLMVQCEKCLRWQHCDCVRASGTEEHYLCDRCEPRYYDQEILLAPQPADAPSDCKHYMTLVKDDVQYAVGDCVYVMRDCKRTASGTPLRSSHRLMATTNPEKLDIFRLEQLWKDPKGEMFASGTPYLRPQETFHEPTRKFLHNELFRTPNYEIVPMEQVMGKCVVMDSNNYCKGRPKGFREQDVYVCEYRVDKTAHLFNKIKEIWYPINTSKFCFDWFETKLTLKRTFAPHEIPEEYRRKAQPCNKCTTSEEASTDVKPDVKSRLKSQVMQGRVKVDESIRNDIKLKAEVKVNVKKGSLLKSELGTQLLQEKPSIVKMLEQQKQDKKNRLNKILLKLLNNIPGKQKIDVSYLLDGGRRNRKKLVK